MQIAELYRLLESLQPTPVVQVNRAVAEAEAFGPAEGLAIIERVSGADNWHLFWATKADLERRAGERRAAEVSYRRALDCKMNDSDRRFLEARYSELAAKR